MTVPIYNMTDTWNNAGTTYTAIKMNVTDTASNAASLLINLQVGGSSQFSIRKDGLVVCSATGAYTSSGGSLYLAVSGVSQIVQIGSGFMNLGGVFGLGPSNTPGSADTLLFRDDANTLALRNSTNAQTFNIYNTYTNGSNYERLEIAWLTNVMTIRPAAAGSGTLRSMALGGSGSGQLGLNANGTIDFNRQGVATRWQIDTSGHFVAGTDNTYDIGASGATRPRTIYVGTNVIAAGTFASTGGNFNCSPGGDIYWDTRSHMRSAADGSVTMTNTAGTGFTSLVLGTIGIYQGSGSPEGVVTAAAGSIYLNTAGGTDTALYTKGSGSGNTGWVAVDNV